MLQPFLYLSLTLFYLAMLSVTTAMKFIIVIIIDSLILTGLVSGSRPSLNKRHTEKVLLQSTAPPPPRRSIHTWGKRSISEISDGPGASKVLKAPVDSPLGTPGSSLSDSSAISDSQTPLGAQLNQQESTKIAPESDDEDDISLSPSDINASFPNRLITTQDDSPSSSSNFNPRFRSHTLDDDYGSNSNEASLEIEPVPSDETSGSSNDPKIATKLPNIISSKLPVTSANEAKHVVTKGKVAALAKYFESWLNSNSQVVGDVKKDPNVSGQAQSRTGTTNEDGHVASTQASPSGKKVSKLNLDNGHETQVLQNPINANEAQPKKESEEDLNQTNQHFPSSVPSPPSKPMEESRHVPTRLNGQILPTIIEQIESDEIKPDSSINTPRFEDLSGLNKKENEMHSENNQVEEGIPASEPSVHIQTKGDVDHREPVELSNSGKTHDSTPQNPSENKEDRSVENYVASGQELEKSPHTDATRKVQPSSSTQNQIKDEENHPVTNPVEAPKPMTQHLQEESHHPTTAFVKEPNSSLQQAIAMTQPEPSILVESATDSEQKINTANRIVDNVDGEFKHRPLLPALSKKQTYKQTLNPLQISKKTLLPPKSRQVSYAPKASRFGQTSYQSEGSKNLIPTAATTHFSNRISSTSFKSQQMSSPIKNSNESKLNPILESVENTGPSTEKPDSAGPNVSESQLEQPKPSSSKSLFFLEAFNEPDYNAALGIKESQEKQSPTRNSFDSISIKSPPVTPTPSESNLPDQPSLVRGNSEAVITHSSIPKTPGILKGILKKPNSPLSKNKSLKDVKFGNQHPVTPKTRFSNESADGKDGKTIEQIRIIPANTNDGIEKTLVEEISDRGAPLIKSKSAYFHYPNGRKVPTKAGLSKATFSFRNINVSLDSSDDEESLSRVTARPRPMLRRINRKDMDLALSKAFINKKRLQRDPDFSPPSKKAPYYVMKATLINRKLYGHSGIVPKRKPNTSKKNNKLPKPRKLHSNWNYIHAFISRVQKLNLGKIAPLLIQQPALKLHLLYPDSFPLPSFQQ